MAKMPAPRSLMVLASLVLALSLITGTALARFVLAGPPAAVPSPTTGPEVDLVRRFYAAVNTALQTGQTGDLAALLSADFTEHPGRTGTASGPAGLIETLTAVRATFPELQIVVEDVRASGDQVTARVKLHGASGRFVGLPLGEEQVPWGPIDLFRIAGGMIAEHWGVPADAAHFAPPVQGQIRLPADPLRRVVLERRRYAPDAIWSKEKAAGPVLLFSERGSLTARIDEAAVTPAMLVHSGAPGGKPWSEPIAARAIATIMPGELLALPQGARFMTSNWEETTADLLVLTFVVPVIPGGAPAPEVMAPKGVAREHVATGPAALLPPDAVVAIGRVTLGAGSEVPLHIAAGPELLIVESGTPTLASGEEHAWIRSGNDPELRGKRLALLRPGDGAFVPAGAAAAYRGNGSEPAALLLVTILPRE